MNIKNQNKNYVAVIGDIINSKELKNRDEVQEKLKKILLKINKEYEDNIASNFTITLGDEFQGLLKNRNSVIKAVSEIEMALMPVNIRFGIGIGEINTRINLLNTSEIDGTAYHRARKMLTEIENKETQYTESISNIMICSGEEKDTLDELFNSIFSVCTALKSKWTDRQKEIIFAYLSNDKNQYKTAEALQIGQSSVNKSLNKSKFYTYKNALETIEKYLIMSGGDKFV